MVFALLHGQENPVCSQLALAETGPQCYPCMFRFYVQVKNNHVRGGTGLFFFVWKAFVLISITHKLNFKVTFHLLFMFTSDWNSTKCFGNDLVPVFDVLFFLPNNWETLYYLAIQHTVRHVCLDWPDVQRTAGMLINTNIQHLVAPAIYFSFIWMCFFLHTYIRNIYT